MINRDEWIGEEEVTWNQEKFQKKKTLNPMKWIQREEWMDEKSLTEINGWRNYELRKVQKNNVKTNEWMNEE